MSCAGRGHRRRLYCGALQYIRGSVPNDSVGSEACGPAAALGTRWSGSLCCNRLERGAGRGQCDRAVRWTLPTPAPPGDSSLRWRVLPATDGSSVYVQAVLDGGSPTYLGTRRVDARTGIELASDIKFEIYWYDNVVLWTALTPRGELQMAIERARAAGGGYRLRTFDPLTLKMLSDAPQPTAPVLPVHSGS